MSKKCFSIDLLFFFLLCWKCFDCSANVHSILRTIQLAQYFLNLLNLKIVDSHNDKKQFQFFVTICCLWNLVSTLYLFSMNYSRIGHINKGILYTHKRTIFVFISYSSFAPFFTIQPLHNCNSQVIGKLKSTSVIVLC